MVKHSSSKIVFMLHTYRTRKREKKGSGSGWDSLTEITAVGLLPKLVSFQGKNIIQRKLNDVQVFKSASYPTTSSVTQGQSVGGGRNGATKAEFSRTCEGAPATSQVLENFRRAISPAPADCPWVSEDDPTTVS